MLKSEFIAQADAAEAREEVRALVHCMAAHTEEEALAAHNTLHALRDKS